MKRPLAALTLLALPLVPLAQAAAGAAPTPAAAAVELVAPPQNDFWEQFLQAMKIGAKDEMSRLVRTNQNDAMNKIIEICEFISETPDAKSEEQIAALRKAWEAAFQSDFVGKVYEYFSLMRPEVRDARKKLKTQYLNANRDFIQAETKKEVHRFGELAYKMEGLAQGFEEIGDHFHASQAYLFAGRGFDEPLRGKDADLARATVNYGKCLASREKVDLKDALYGQTKERHVALEKAGHGDPEKAAPGLAGPIEASSAITFQPSFEPVTDVEAYRRPIYMGDSIYQAWPTLDLRAPGTNARFAGMRDGGPNVKREGSSQVLIDANGDGTWDTEIPITGNVEPVELTLGSGPLERRWAFLARIGNSRDTYNDIQFNLEPAQNNMTIYIAPAGSLVGTIAGETVRILDDNMDGVYGSDPLLWNHVGMVEGRSQADLDSVVIGNDKVAQPWSEFLKIGDDWYRMEVDQETMEIRAGLVPELETGNLKVSMKGPGLDWLVVKGQTGTFEKSFFEVAANKGVEVPAGRYELFLGQVSKGKRDQMAKALVVPGTNTQVWTVEPGKTTTLELGAPFGFDFQVDQEEESVTVYGDSIAVTGKAGETYQRLWNCVTRPEVSVREAGKKRGGKGEDMKRPGSQEEVAQVGFKYAWFPLDLTLPKKPDKGAEVQLVEKKNKLFGKIESDWKD